MWWFPISSASPNHYRLPDNNSIILAEVKVPIAILGAEIDKISPPELVKQFEDILSTKTEVPSFVKIYGAYAHGWTMRYNVEDEKAVKATEEAREDMLNWFIKYK